MFSEILEKVKVTTPLVHCITNYVTVNDCANILLACGGSPIMADDIGEVEEITSVCNALVLNIGTLNERTIESMRAAGKRAAALLHPIVLDPVGAGASKLRTETALSLLREAKPAVVRGNISEIRALANTGGGARGVDAAAGDAVTEANLKEAVAFAKFFARHAGAVIVITGAIDIVADAGRAYVIKNGHSMMAKVSGTGCMLTAVLGAYCAANPGDTLAAVAAGVAAMGMCGELAYQKLTGMDGGASTYRMLLIDTMSKLDGSTLEGGAKIEQV